MVAWSEIRRYHLNKLIQAIKEDKVDRDILPILNIINSFDEYVTRSSCYGRITFTIEKGLIRKGEGKIINKIHGPVNPEYIKKVSDSVDKGVLWMNIEGTIIHVASKTYEDGLKLYNIALDAGYRESSIYSMSKRGVTIEILYTTKYSIPIYSPETGFIISDEELRSISNYIHNMFIGIEKAKYRLINILSEYKAYEDKYS
ncbi:MAG TPA: hypothetical protein EYH44_00985 [Thermoprotei archaeon]|nr:hypothetical protein [Thermoprotei archaeon]